MTAHEFSIIASGLDHTTDNFESCFYDHGCDDALVSFQKGNIILDFAREAETLELAIESAIEDVRNAGATVERVEPDPLVNLTDIAERAGLSKAAISLYTSGKRGKGFPSPHVRATSSTPLWQWSGVARWFVAQGTLPEQVKVDAVVFQRVNAKLELESA